MLYNLKEYHRPDSLDEAKRLLRRRDIHTVALAGRINVVGRDNRQIEAVVDLSNLGLDFIDRQGKMLHLGSMITLQRMVDELGDVFGGLLADMAERMAGWNIRNQATLGGTLASGDIHTPLSVALAALGARVRLYEEPGELPHWADLANQARLTGLRGQIITTVSLKVPDEIGVGYAQVARTPVDRPIVCAVSTASHLDRQHIDTYTAVGGLLRDLTLIDHQVLPHDIRNGIDEMGEKVVRENIPNATFLNDHLGSADYRRDVAPVLARRALRQALQQVGVGLD